MQDLRQTESWYRYMKFIGWEVVEVDGSDNARLFGRKFPVTLSGVMKLLLYCLGFIRSVI
jgi:hypothetical protein